MNRAAWRRGCWLGALLMLAGCTGPRTGTYAPAPRAPWYARSAARLCWWRKPPSETEPAPGAFVRIAEEAPGGAFTPEEEVGAMRFADAAAVQAFSAKVDGRYRIGPGDRFSFLVRGRADISRDEVVVAPDGLVALPRVGVFRIAGMTIPEATEYVQEKLSAFYEDPDAHLLLSHINNNKVFVLGRVANPGAVHFSGPGTLLEALSLAGGLPADTRLSFLSRCMIVRGSDMLIWIDLRDLLEHGNLAMNTRLQNGDFIFIPQSEDQVAYIMGEVPRPGLLVLRSQMTLLDAVMQAGGANPERRAGQDVPGAHGGGQGARGADQFPGDVQSGRPATELRAQGWGHCLRGAERDGASQYVHHAVDAGDAGRGFHVEHRRGIWRDG